MVSRHVRLGRDTPLKVDRDALRDSKQDKDQSEGRASSLVFLERGGELPSQRVSFVPERRPACDSGPAGGQERKQARAAGGSEGSGAAGVLLMAASTSDFWREVLKTPS